MSEHTSLSELAAFVGQSALSSENLSQRRRAVGSLAYQVAPNLQKRRVGDLLGMVMALSSRTRRMVLPKVDVDLDVFGPSGKRAVQIHFGETE